MIPDAADEVRVRLFGQWAFVPERLLGLLAVAAGEELERTLPTVRRREDVELRTAALAVIAGRLDEQSRGKLLDEAATTARAIDAPWRRAKALGSVAQAVNSDERPTLLREIIAAIGAVNDPYWRVVAIEATVAEVDSVSIQDFVRVAQAIRQPVYRCNALLAIARVGPESERMAIAAQAINAARRIRAPYL